MWTKQRVTGLVLTGENSEIGTGIGKGDGHTQLCRDGKSTTPGQKYDMDAIPKVNSVIWRAIQHAEQKQHRGDYRFGKCWSIISDHCRSRVSPEQSVRR